VTIAKPHARGARTVAKVQYYKSQRDLPQMLKSLRKSRPANFYANQVKVLLLLGIGVLLWTNTGARQFTSDALYNASEVIRPR